MQTPESSLMPMGKGMVLGKFMPPHKGHVYLVEFARQYCQQLAVVVGTLPTEPIPGALRHGWMQELFPNCQVLHLDKALPQYPEEAHDFWQQWRESLLAILPWRPDYVFASEDYGERLAAELGAQFVPVDISRQVLPVSGTAVRENPLANWAYLPDCVRPYFVKKVCVFGPESTGKSTLTQRLAQHFGTVWVPEYAQLLLARQAGELVPTDMLRIARGQLAAEAALSSQAKRLLFCDTDLLTSTLWAEELFGQVPEALWQAAQQQHYDLYLLCDVDVPWVEDVHRLRPEQRKAFFERCRSLLEREQRPYVVIQGDWEQRWHLALQAVERLISC